ncbi:MAG: alpha/beta hydrolase [Asticcacaulis sp.]
MSFAQIALKTLVRTAVITPVVMATIAAGVLTLTAPKAPPPLASIENASSPYAGYAREQPAARFLTARDGGKLAYRLYPAEGAEKGVVVLVHGSSGTGLTVHSLAKAIAAKGMSVYAPDLRGHGQSPGPDGRLGDIVHRTQYSEDLGDFAAHIRRQHPGQKRLLAGFSMSGGLILRHAGEAEARARSKDARSKDGGDYDAYLAISPFIAPGTVMDRPNQGGWTTVSVPRIVTLSILNQMGISAFDHLTVLAMAVPKDLQAGRPANYSHALLASSSLPRPWEKTVAAIKAPTRVIIGAQDELFVAEAYPDALKAVNPALSVRLVAGVDHMGMMLNPAAHDAIRTEAEALLGQ